MSSTNTPNILLLTRRFSPPYTGGVPSYYKNMVRNLNEINAFVITSGLKIQPQVENDCVEEKANKYCIKRVDFIPGKMGLQLNLTWLWSLIRMVYSITKTVINRRIDVIIVGQVQMFLLLSTFIAKLFVRKPYILFLHGEEIPQIYLKSNKLLRLLYSQASGFFCNSNFTAGRLRRFAKLNKMIPVIITPGVEDRFFERPEIGSIKQRMGLEHRRILYTIARLDERKGHDLVIEALPLVIEKYPDIVYLIGGEGPRLEYLRDLVEKLFLAAHVKFLGFVNDEDLVSYHYMGEIFVMPNRILEDGDTEGFGIVFLEANAVGNPVIGGNEGGSVDAIIDGVTGYLVNPRSTENIAGKICLLLENDDLRRKMGRTGRQRAWNEFRWEILTKKFEDSLIELFEKIP